MSSGASGSSLGRLVSELEEALALLGADRVTPARLKVLLARGESRAWRVVSVDEHGLLSVECPLGAGPAWVAAARPWDGEPVTGSFVTGRSMPVGPRRWVLLGRPVVLVPDAAHDFERLLRSLRAPRGEFWRVHGTALAQAARAA